MDTQKRTTLLIALYVPYSMEVSDLVGRFGVGRHRAAGGRLQLLAGAVLIVRVLLYFR